MKFDTSNQNGLLAAILISIGGAYSFAVILMQIIDPFALAVTSAIMLIVGSLLYGVGAIMLIQNSKLAQQSTTLDMASSNLTQLVFLISLFLVVIAGIFVAF